MAAKKALKAAEKTTKVAAPKCAGCGEAAAHTCPQCGKPTCRRSVGMCGHVDGICGECLGAAILALG